MLAWHKHYINISINIEVNNMKINTLFQNSKLCVIDKIIFTRIAIDPNKIIGLQINILNIDLKLEKLLGVQEGN